MFTKLVYLGYDDEHACNMFDLCDSCFVHRITTPYGSPSLARTKDRHTNTITVFAVIKHYESINRNVSLNLAHYYKWLYEQGYYVDKKFISSQLHLLDQVLGLKLSLKYCNNTFTYLRLQSLLEIG